MNPYQYPYSQSNYHCYPGYSTYQNTYSSIPTGYEIPNTIDLQTSYVPPQTTPVNQPYTPTYSTEPQSNTLKTNTFTLISKGYNLLSEEIKKCAAVVQKRLPDQFYYCLKTNVKVNLMIGIVILPLVGTSLTGIISSLAFRAIGSVVMTSVWGLSHELVVKHGYVYSKNSPALRSLIDTVHYVWIVSFTNTILFNNYDFFISPVIRLAWNYKSAKESIAAEKQAFDARLEELSIPKKQVKIEIHNELKNDIHNHELTTLNKKMKTFSFYIF